VKPAASYVSVPLPRCACGAEPVVVSAGRDGEFTDLRGTRIYTVRPIADTGFCLACAALLCWPWPSERRRKA
jgi:hypothetical protein